MRRLEAFSHNSKRTMLIQYIYLIAADSFGGLFFIRERSSIENDLMTRGMHFPKQKNCYHLSQSHREMRRNRALDFSSLNGVFSRDHSVDTWYSYRYAQVWYGYPHLMLFLSDMTLSRASSRHSSHHYRNWTNNHMPLREVRGVFLWHEIFSHGKIWGVQLRDSHFVRRGAIVGWVSHLYRSPRWYSVHHQR